MNLAAIAAVSICMVCTGSMLALFLWMAMPTVLQTVAADTRTFVVASTTPILVFLTAIGASIVHAIRRERWWAREAMFVASVIVGIGGALASGFLVGLPGLLTAPIVPFVSGVYLYGRTNINGYYEDLLGRSKAVSPGGRGRG